MKSPCCLLVDDEPGLLETISLMLERMRPKLTCLTAENLREAKTLLETRAPDLCLTDMRLPDGNGLELIEYIQKKHPQVPVAMITAYSSVESAINALKAGAFDYIPKPVTQENLRNVVNAALRLSEQDKKNEDKIRLIGNAPSMDELRRKIDKVARSQAPAYISGESGTGKELVARMIHVKSPRAEQPFVPVNCGAIPSELMESEFFGHRKGSFTGAVADKPGLFQTAHGGTLFLDEVADLPLNMQVKLLRAIQEKQIRPVGAQQEIPVDVRILSATHKDLAKLVQDGDFRQDLYYRINVIELRVPPLRERRADILPLVKHILERLCSQPNTAWEQQSPHLSEAAEQALLNYAFPGNIRELENILERAMTLCENLQIEEEDLQLPVHQAPTPEAAAPQKAAAVAQSSAHQALDPMLDDLEKQRILKALEQTHWNRTKAAKLLGVTFSTLRYRLKKFKLDKPEVE